MVDKSTQASQTNGWHRTEKKENPTEITENPTKKRENPTEKSGNPRKKRENQMEIGQIRESNTKNKTGGDHLSGTNCSGIGSCGDEETNAASNGVKTHKDIQENDETKGKRPGLWKNLTQDTIAVVAGSFLFAMSLNEFLTPAGIILGGASGLGVAANQLWGMRVGAVILLINVPLFFINFKLYGLQFCAKTLVGTLATSIAIDLFTFFPVTLTDPLLCCVFGAVTMGIGVGILFSRGFTTGGTDHVVWMVRHRFRQISTGRIIMLVDAGVILLCALLLRNYESIFYSALGIYIYSYVVELVQDGFHRGEMVWIISHANGVIAREIASTMQRGITLLEGRGWYGGERQEMLLCAIRKSEFYRIRQIVNRHDSAAFVMVLSASEVLGLGFETIG